MPVRTRSSSSDESIDARLALMDQGFFAGHRAAGHKEVTQCVWVYEHPVDFDGLRRFHHNLGYGLMGRRIERSPLPFGRHRWVVDRWPLDIDIAPCARPRAELSDWVDERSQLPTDAEWGPSWHLGVLPLSDGATAVTLVASHYVVDGLGFVVAVADALLGNTRDLGYPPPHSRTRLRAMLQDARQTARDAPQVGRALVAAARLARKQAQDRRHGDRSPALRPAAGVGTNDTIVVPGITIYVGLQDWDARANALGGTSSTLVAGLAAKLAERMGRRRSSDGAVTLQLPISDRAEGDTRAVALSLARVSIDPTRVTADLSDARAAIRQALTTLRETPDEAAQLLWLAPWTPKPTFKRMVDAGFADPDLPVIVSNLGDLGPVNRIDGTPSEYLAGRGMRQDLTRGWLERIGGEMYLLSLRIDGKISITVRAYQPGAENTKPALRELAKRTLADFDLTGEID